MQEILPSHWLSLETIGITLAVLSFTGASEKIEATLVAMRKWVADYTPVLRHGLVEFLPTPANFRRHGGVAVYTMVVTLVIATLFMLLTKETRTELYSAYSLILPWTWWKALLITVLIVPTLYFFATLITLVGSVIVYCALTILWSIFWALSRPPSGIMGSIGLIVALSGPALRLLNGT